MVRASSSWALRRQLLRCRWSSRGVEPFAPPNRSIPPPLFPDSSPLLLIHLGVNFYADPQAQQLTSYYDSRVRSTTSYVVITSLLLLLPLLLVALVVMATTMAAMAAAPRPLFLWQHLGSNSQPGSLQGLRCRLPRLATGLSPRPSPCLLVATRASSVDDGSEPAPKVF